MHKLPRMESVTSEILKENNKILAFHFFILKRYVHFKSF